MTGPGIGAGVAVIIRAACTIVTPGGSAYVIDATLDCPTCVEATPGCPAYLVVTPGCPAYVVITPGCPAYRSVTRRHLRQAYA